MLTKHSLKKQEKFIVLIVIITVTRIKPLNGTVVSFMTTWKHVVVNEKGPIPDSLTGNLFPKTVNNGRKSQLNLSTVMVGITTELISTLLGSVDFHCGVA